MDIEYIWLGRDNEIDLQMNADDSPMDLSGLTKMELVFDDGTIIDSDISPTAFDWSVGSGTVKLVLGRESIDSGYYMMTVIIYDATYTNGLIWGRVPVIIDYSRIAENEKTSIDDAVGIEESTTISIVTP